MFSDIKIIQVDKVLCPADWSWESRKNGWSGYHIWYVTGGGATIKVEGNTYHLTTGDCFLFDLNKNHFCTHNPNTPLDVYTIYVHVDNLKPSSIRRWIIHNDTILGGMICRCVKQYAQNKPLSEMYLKPILGEFLLDDTKEKEMSPAVSKICGLLDKNTKILYQLDDMCRLTGYSKNQIIRLFRKDTDMTPIQFQLQHKMQYAAKLLCYSNKTIAEIAFETGIEDTNYFSKIFKKYIGLSPRNYRNSRK